ncbi:MAG: 3-deoxy-D-manno-octulosonic acid transferase [Candidatus Rokubacteria bacterium]|nr:3-deoxy-D-manno-octulosonic acid transferase [Candidatus Rokubacteria bacterium]
MYAFYTVGFTLAIVGYLPVLLLRHLKRGGFARLLRQRFGRLDGLPPAPRCWIHAVSVGEAIAAVPLVEGIRRLWPGLNIVVSTQTATGAAIVRDRLGHLASHCYFPFDLPGPIKRALGAIAPIFFVALETEIWPNFFRQLHRRGIPAMIANGRISDRSFRRYRLVRLFMGRLLGQISMFAMQSAEDARRIIALGAPPERVIVTGNLKVEAPPHEAGVEALWRRLLGLTGAEPVWIAGSTHAGEEEIVLDAFLRLQARHPSLVLVLAPRHPERVPEVERLVRARGLEPVRRTLLPIRAGAGAVIVLDTVGELAQLYQVASVVFVGGSLVSWGGHNMLEPALRRKPVLLGPHTANFRESAELLLAAGGALPVNDGHELEAAVHRLLRSPELARTTGEAGFEAVASRQGAVKQTLELLERLVLSPTR